jgi:hypothetical protein
MKKLLLIIIISIFCVSCGKKNNPEYKVGNLSKTIEYII